MLQQCLPLAVLKHCHKRGIQCRGVLPRLQQCLPLAVLKRQDDIDGSTAQLKMLQQCLPLAVLKHYHLLLRWIFSSLTLQQCLPLAVLKRVHLRRRIDRNLILVATVLTACGIETNEAGFDAREDAGGCNSAYRLRY